MACVAPHCLRRAARARAAARLASTAARTPARPRTLLRSQASWQYLAETMPGNHDASSVVTHDISAGMTQPLVARCVKVRPVACARAASAAPGAVAAVAPAARRPEACGLRLDVMGRDVNADASVAARSLGVAAGGRLPARALTASSEASLGARAEAGRLNGGVRALRAGGWSPGCPPSAAAGGGGSSDGVLAGAGAFAFRRLEAPAKAAAAAAAKALPPAGAGGNGDEGGDGGEDAKAAPQSSVALAKAAAAAAAKPADGSGGNGTDGDGDSGAGSGGVGAVDGCGVRWRDGDERAWLQIDLGRELVVSAIGTQGSETLQTYVTDYDASFSNDGVHFVTPFPAAEAPVGLRAGSRRRRSGHRGIALPRSLADAQAESVYVLPRPVSARYVRLAPLAWRSAAAAPPPVTAPGLRVELYGPAGYAPGERGCRLQEGAVLARSATLRAPAAAAHASSGGGLPADLVAAESMGAPAGEILPPLQLLLGGDGGEVLLREHK